MQKHIGFAEKLLEWYRIHKRDLPWRSTTDPYKIWVSEIILQQTRVQQGLPYYERFIAGFPTVVHLANAHQDEVLRLWQGLGYYSRARNMHSASKYVSEELNGTFPPDFESLLKMKGVGRYTAAAIASFAYNEVVPVVDGNVQRVISRVFGVSDDISSPKTQKIFEKIAADHISSEEPGIFNQAIMEFGAQFCTPSKPDCDNCIFRTICFAHANNMVSQLPVKLKKTKVRKRYFQYIVFKSGNEIAMRQRIGKDIWEGLFEFYLIESDKEMLESEVTNALAESNYGKLVLEKISEQKPHILSHQKIHSTFYIFQVQNRLSIEKQGLVFYKPFEIENLAKPVLVLNYLREENLF